MKNNTIPSQWTSVNLYRLGRWDGREWFGEVCSKPITVNAVPATSPSIQSLQIREALTNTQKDGQIFPDQYLYS